jgi:hypothetical protein
MNSKKNYSNKINYVPVFKYSLIGLWSVYVLKFKKYPYFMDLPEFRPERMIKQCVLLAFGTWSIFLVFNVYGIIENKE